MTLLDSVCVLIIFLLNNGAIEGTPITILPSANAQKSK